jgi:hypothetical protein
MLFSLRASRIAISERRMNVCFSATNLSYQKTALGRVLSVVKTNALVTNCPNDGQRMPAYTAQYMKEETTYLWRSKGAGRWVATRHQRTKFQIK